MGGEIIVTAVAFFFLFLIVSGMGFWSLKRKDPMHFWSGTTVASETITDVRKYNRANAIMWFSYALSILLYIISMISTTCRVINSF